MKRTSLALLLGAFFLLSFPCHANPEGMKAYNAGMAAYKKKEYQNAVYAFEHSINFDPKLYNSWCMLGLAYVLNDEPQKGEETYLKAIENFPNEWKAYTLLAEFYKMQNNSEKALLYHQKGLDLMPKKESKNYQKKIDALKSEQETEWVVSETEKENILSNIITPIDKNLWRVALVEKKESAIHVAYALKNENYRSGKWSKTLDLTCTYTEKQDSAHFNKINEWMASTYRRSNADMDTISKTNTTRLYESAIYDKKVNIIGYIFPVNKGFCIAQFMYKKKLSTKEKNNWYSDIKKITVRKF